MNKIINGIILSVYPDHFKFTLLDKVLGAYNTDKAEETTDLLKYATELALNKGKLERGISTKILQKVSNVQPNVFNEFFKYQSLSLIISNSYQNPSSVPPSVALLHQVLKLKAATSHDKIDSGTLNKMYLWLYSIFKPATNSELQENLCNVLLYLGRSSNDFVQISNKATNMLQVLVTWLSTVDFLNTEPVAYTSHVQSLVDFMLLLWNNFSSDLVLSTLSHVFVRVSSAAFPSPPSPAVQNVLHCAPDLLIWAAAPYITANASIKDPQLELALSRILKWPLTMNTGIQAFHLWVVGLLQGLIEAKKFTVLARIILKSVETVLSQVWVERTSKGALHVLEHIRSYFLLH